MVFALQASPSPETIRELAREVIQRPEYQMERGIDSSPLWSWLLELLRWLVKPIQALFSVLHAISPPLAWLVIVLLVILLIALLSHIIYTFRHAMQAQQTKGGKRLSKARPLDPETLEREARDCYVMQNYIASIRLLFRASLLRLQQSERRFPQQGATNRELLRLYRNTAAFDPLQLFVETIDAKWYGRETCDENDYERCARAYEQLRQVVRSGREESGHAHSS